MTILDPLHEVTDTVNDKSYMRENFCSFHGFLPINHKSFLPTN